MDGDCRVGRCCCWHRFWDNAESHESVAHVDDPRSRWVTPISASTHQSHDEHSSDRHRCHRILRHLACSALLLRNAGVLMSAGTLCALMCVNMGFIARRHLDQEEPLPWLSLALYVACLSASIWCISGALGSDAWTSWPAIAGLVAGVTAAAAAAVLAAIIFWRCPPPPRATCEGPATTSP